MGARDGRQGRDKSRATPTQILQSYSKRRLIAPRPPRIPSSSSESSPWVPRRKRAAVPLAAPPPLPPPRPPFGCSSRAALRRPRRREGSSDRGAGWSGPDVATPLPQEPLKSRVETASGAAAPGSGSNARSDPRPPRRLNTGAGVADPLPSLYTGNTGKLRPGAGSSAWVRKAAFSPASRLRLLLRWAGAERLLESIGRTLVRDPAARHRPSRNTTADPGTRYSGWCRNRKRTLRWRADALASGGAVDAVASPTWAGQLTNTTRAACRTNAQNTMTVCPCRRTSSGRVHAAIVASNVDDTRTRRAESANGCPGSRPMPPAGHPRSAEPTAASSALRE